MDSPHQDENAPEKVTPISRQHSPDFSDNAEIGETELRQTLKERHVNMIGFSSAVGIGIFLSAGNAIFMAGPGAAVIAYVVSGSIVSSVMASLGEMTALLPVKGPLFEFARRFIDQSIGLATGWMVWFSSIVILATEILGITEIIKFRFDPEYLEAVAYPENQIEWSVGLSTNPAVWVGIFLLIIMLPNCLPVRQFGRIEYMFGCLKITFLVGLILFNVILSARKRFHASRFWTYESPYSFSTPNMTVQANYHPNGDPLVYTGALGGFVSFWTTMTTTLFSLVGWEIIFFTAAENRDLRRSEAMKLATRKITLRVVLLYSLATFAVGLNVPYDDANLRNLTLYGISGGQNSAFVIAAVREHVKGFPHLFNGFFIFSATSSALTALYSSSRTLHALASIRDAWPPWPMFESIRSRLERTKMGVPLNAVFVSWLVGFLAFLSTKPSQALILGRMSTIIVVCNLIIYAVNCIAYLQFYRIIQAAARGDLDEDLNLTPEMRNLYKRTARRYPYRSHFQWVRAGYALTGCSLMVLFQGWRTLVPPVATADFVASYIAIIIFLVLSMAYFFKDRGFSPRNWKGIAIKLSGFEAFGPTVVNEESITKPCEYCGAKHRRGHLRFPDGTFFTMRNLKALGEWIWVWVK